MNQTGQLIITALLSTGLTAVVMTDGIHLSHEVPSIKSGVLPSQPATAATKSEQTAECEVGTIISSGGEAPVTKRVTTTELAFESKVISEELNESTMVSHIGPFIDVDALNDNDRFDGEVSHIGVPMDVEQLYPEVHQEIAHIGHYIDVDEFLQQRADEVVHHIGEPLPPPDVEYPGWQGQEINNQSQKQQHIGAYIDVDRI
jgi:hypothetical protein